VRVAPVPLIPPGHEAVRVSGAKEIGLVDRGQLHTPGSSRPHRAPPPTGPGRPTGRTVAGPLTHQVLTGHDGQVMTVAVRGAAGRHPGHRQRPPGRHGAAVAAGRQHPARAPAETIDTGGPCRRSRQYHRHCGRVRHRRPPASAPATHTQRCCCSISWNEDLSARRSDNGLSSAHQATRMPGEGLRTV
jgi:hypothetical protein